ncbi:uncharacterized protein TNCV_3122551 [Trichonephila clavipes]|nr:uncharacterized protein TNCV_3122551 [Trichonephila clavipes]
MSPEIWNENPDGPEELIQSYRMTRVLFGVSYKSPFLLAETIKHHLKRCTDTLIQELWCLGLDWDEFFPKNLESSWNEWCEEVPELNTFSIPRYYLGYALQNEIDNIQIHCFSDSSKKAYGTVVYLRIALKNGKTFTNFVASKCRVAPLKTISLPRLELMGALLSARFSYKISKTINYITSRYFWTDSSITYFWIKGSAARFKPFVKNRIQEIQKYTDPIEWRHCPGKDNPANLLSRDMSASELRSSELWWHGPPWLIQNESSWPKALDFSKEIDIEQIGKNMSFAKRNYEGIHPGSDGLVRVIRIRTSRGVFIRTAASVCPLPFEDVGPPSNGGGMFRLSTPELIFANFALM